MYRLSLTSCGFYCRVTELIRSGLWHRGISLTTESSNPFLLYRFSKERNPLSCLEDWGCVGVGMGSKLGYFRKAAGSLSDEYVDWQFIILKTYTFALIWAWSPQVQSLSHSIFSNLENILFIFSWSTASLKDSYTDFQPILPHLTPMCTWSWGCMVLCVLTIFLVLCGTNKLTSWALLVSTPNLTIATHLSAFQIFIIIIVFAFVGL